MYIHSHGSCTETYMCPCLVKVMWVSDVSDVKTKLIQYVEINQLKIYIEKSWCVLIILYTDYLINYINEWD